MKKTDAHATMRDVLRKLPAGWKGRCWDNCGWHVEWFNGAVKLHFSDDRFAKRTGRHFWAMVGDPGADGGIPMLTRDKIRCFKNPLSAVRSAVKYAQERISPIKYSLDNVEASL